MNKVRKVTAIAAGAIAALAVGGAALAAGADDPSPEATSGEVTMLPNGDVVEPSPTESASASASPSPSASTSSSPGASTSSSPGASATVDDSSSRNGGVDDSASPSSSASPGAGPSRRATSVVGISVDRAKAIALRAAGGGWVESIERETEHGRAAWDVDVIVGGVEHDVDVDQATGAVIRHRVDKSEDSGRGRGSDDSGRHGGDDKGGDDHGGRHGGHGSDD
ncbi:PepSY domain-containing protein [Actinoplanes sp. NBRC 103695]|uniref:PepSY domain-containing protein n=1 Tax=Actinoplanes sp. NBRC 103695 TaxID=3032202 RepID=UPI00249FF54F|nr:PepSY domain-containing protein [Actinoplanes sp. NBRC 103695]GLY93511.1 hypothetical protein Acsp02_07670 [Actinoplanes sp. NBRC 103695]